MSCPFGFGNADEGDASDTLEGEEPQASSGCPFAKFSSNSESVDPVVKEGDSPKQKGNKEGRFNVDKDPVSWFFQHQIKSEEEFQKKKATLREVAKKQLDDIYDKKGKKLQWTSDSDSEWSISTNELSELDSDVDSISSLVSCANSWIGEYNYSMPATTTLKLLTALVVVILVSGLYQSYQAYQTAAEYWGILAREWQSMASIILAVTALFWLPVGVVSWRRMSRRWLVSFMFGLHLLEACGIALAAATMAFPTEVRRQVKKAACGKSAQNDPNMQLSQLCQMLPSITNRLHDANFAVTCTAAAVAGCALALVFACTWYEIELSYMEKRSTKHKRRRRRRKHQIPWDKIKIIGPVSNCGAGAPAQKNSNATNSKPGQHGVATAKNAGSSPLGSAHKTAAGRKHAGGAELASTRADATSPSDTSKVKSS